METLEITTPNNMTNQKIKLIDGCFTASEAADIIHAVLDVKINFHKLQRLSRTEGNVEDSCQYDNGRIDELIAEQIRSKELLKTARLDGKKLRMTSTILIEVDE
ncbi:MAG: hypothetical protein ABNH00_10790 [Dokdonia sp.]|jgi:uncharacterized protein with FMN-binding domain|nr:hypothetical protein [Cytophagaceae bacterium]